MSKNSGKVIASNKKAYFNFEITDTLECGIVLEGAEVKSLRAGNMNLQDAYIRIDRGEMWMMGGYIAPFKQGGQFAEIDTRRTRKLLAHKREIEKLQSKVEEKGLTLMPLKIYFKGNNIKVAIGLARSKKQHDKRRTIKEREQKREMDRARKRFI
jgi:SsrA-binding protein